MRAQDDEAAPLTVAELIVALQQFPQDAIVISWNPFIDMADRPVPTLTTLRHWDGGNPGELPAWRKAAPSDPGAVRTVVLNPELFNG